MKSKLISAERWLDTEDRTFREQRLARVKWVEQLIPSASFRVFPGGWMAKVLLDEASYCFIYGQFVSTVALAFAFIERTLAGRLYNAGWNGARSAKISSLTL
jgi:hypothetical protein